MWIEIGFNLIYLTVIWWLVAAMIRRKSIVAPADRRAANLVIWAFGLLALGDTGHVGFRVLAYALGGLEARFSLFGAEFGLVGLGALSTAVTVTFFYLLVLELWRERFHRGQALPLRYGSLGALLVLAAGVRLILMIPSVNQWNAVVPPQPWSTVRNIPLMIQGLGVAYLILRDARLAGDRPFGWIGISILVSYACYLPVIFFVQQVPMLGMLMIPKTLAYVAIGFISYSELYRAGEHKARQVVDFQSS